MFSKKLDNGASECTRRITPLMMIVFGEGHRSFQVACDLFNNHFFNREPISISTVGGNFHKFGDIVNVKKFTENW